MPTVSVPRTCEVDPVSLILKGIDAASPRFHGSGAAERKNLMRSKQITQLSRSHKPEAQAREPAVPSLALRANKPCRGGTGSQLRWQNPPSPRLQTDRCCERRLRLCVFVLSVLSVSVWLILSPEFERSTRAGDCKRSKSENIRTLQSQYQTERTAAETAGWLKKFSPELTEQADQLAHKAEAALTGGRLTSARQLFLEARRLLPAPPLNFPEHVS